MQERSTGPTVTWHCSVEKIEGEGNGADCYLGLFAYRKFWYVVAVMVQWQMVAELIVAGDLNRDLMRTGRVAVAEFELQDISAHFSPVTESVLMYDHFIVTLAI